MFLLIPKNGLYVIKENPKPNTKRTRHTQNGRASCDNAKNDNDSSLGEVSTEDPLLETSLLEDDVSDISEKVDEINLVKKKEDEERIMRQQIEDEITKARALQLAQQIEDENAKAHALKLATRKACKTWTKQPSDSSQKKSEVRNEKNDEKFEEVKSQCKKTSKKSKKVNSQAGHKVLTTAIEQRAIDTCIERSVQGHLNALVECDTTGSKAKRKKNRQKKEPVDLDELIKKDSLTQANSVILANNKQDEDWVLIE